MRSKIITGGDRTLLSVGLFALTLTTAGAAADFERQVRPILESACLSCHTADQHKGDLIMETRAGLLKGGEDGTSLVPGKPEESPVYTSTVLPPDHDDIMPPKGAPLTKEQALVLKEWIQGGAAWPEGVVLKAVPRIDFVKQIQPLFELQCVACHRDGHDKGGLRMDEKGLAFKGGDDGEGIVPGFPEKSLVYTTTVLAADHDDLMPPSNKGGPLPKDQTELIKEWIRQGASWPEGLVLTPKKAEDLAPADTLVSVGEIHKKILENLKVTQAAEMKPYTQEVPGTGVSFSMVPIPGGEFMMGSPEGEAGRGAQEGPQFRAKIAPFWMGKTEVTWSEFELFMYADEEKKRVMALGNVYDTPVADAVSRPTKPYVEMSFGMGKDGYPAISMTHHAANKFCQWLSARTGQFYRLPTEAEWEYACRAGTTTAYSFGNDPALLKDYAWFTENSDWKYQKVGTKKPNPWGLYDMHGNVAEWVLDELSADFYGQFKGKLAEQPWNRTTKPYPQVARGGSWDDEPGLHRSAARRGSEPDWKRQDPQLPKSIWYLTDAQFLGFRVVRPLAVPGPEELFRYWNNGVEKE